jgi:hypothetical protein
LDPAFVGVQVVRVSRLGSQHGQQLHLPRRQPADLSFQRRDRLDAPVVRQSARLDQRQHRHRMSRRWHRRRPGGDVVGRGHCFGGARFEPVLVHAFYSMRIPIRPNRKPQPCG